MNYQWDFGDGNTSTEASPDHTYAAAGPYEVTLTVTDEGDLTDAITLQVTAEEPISNGFALRINAGGPEVVHNGDTFSADQNFVGGKVYVNTSAQVPPLYQTERSATDLCLQHSTNQRPVSNHPSFCGNLSWRYRRGFRL